MLVQTHQPLGFSVDPNGYGVLSGRGFDEIFFCQCFQKSLGFNGKTLALLVAELANHPVGDVRMKIKPGFIFVANSVLRNKIMDLIFLQQADLFAFQQRKQLVNEHMGGLVRVDAV